MTSPDDWLQLKGYVMSNRDDDSFVQEIWNDAVALVSAFVGTAIVPDNILTRAYLLAGMNMFQARAAQNGIVGFAANDRPVFSPKDALSTVYPLLVRYVGRF